VLNVPKGFKEKVVALTFDDGPEPKVTPKILASLERYEAKATFFVLGNYASRHKELVRKTAEAGHVIGSHTWSHPSKPTKKKAGPEIWKTAATIHAATGQWPSVFRPPYGLDKAYTAQLARREGYPSVIWNKSGADTARNANADSVYINATKWTKPGDIILFHDGPGKSFTAAAVPRILKTLNKNGYEFITVPDMLRRWDSFLAEQERVQRLADAKVKQKLPATAALPGKPRS
jgi:peptidoglycan/xylan/chitin deacetylase (PgdA/CDA1 family)